MLFVAVRFWDRKGFRVHAHFMTRSLANIFLAVGDTVPGQQLLMLHTTEAAYRRSDHKIGLKDTPLFSCQRYGDLAAKELRYVLHYPATKT
jgi:hypothetical protein